MLSINDFREKQILIIKNPANIEAQIKFSNDNIVYCQNGETRDQISCYKILALFIIGDSSLTTMFIRQAVKFGISIFLINRNLEVYSSIESKAEGNYLLRMKQYKFGNDLEIAKYFVKNKLLNQFSLLDSAVFPAGKEYNYEINEKAIIKKISLAKDDKTLLGIEGSCTKNFFKIFFSELDWYKRLPRTKIDHYNLLLDLGYTMLLNYIDSLLRLYGFDVYKGYYHKLFFKRKSLSCDLVEPFRCIIDKQLVKSFHLKQINKKDFRRINGRFSLDYNKSDKYLEIFLSAILSRKEEIFNYIHSFYLYINDNNKPFPYFKI